MTARAEVAAAWLEVMTARLEVAPARLEVTTWRLVGETAGLQVAAASREVVPHVQRSHIQRQTARCIGILP